MSYDSWNPFSFQTTGLCIDLGSMTGPVSIIQYLLGTVKCTVYILPHKTMQYDRSIMALLMLA